MTYSAELSTPAVGSPQMISNPNGTIMPSLMIRSDDGWIVAGHTNQSRQAWAGKIDDSGKIVWEYRRDLLDEDKPALKGIIAAHPDFKGGTLLEDGSIFLCGDMRRPLPNPSGYPLNPFITKLDAEGKLIREQFIRPIGDRHQDFSSLFRCMAWHGSVIGIGSVYSTKSMKSDYWITLFDVDGNVKWERIIKPIGSDPFSSSVYNLSVKLGKENLIFSGASNVNRSPGTDVFSLDFNGNLISSYNTAGEYLMVEDRNQDHEVNLYGTPVTDKHETANLIKLDMTLKEIGRSANVPNNGFSANAMFRNPDGSLTGFGAVTYHGDASLIGAVNHLSENLEKQKILKISGTPGFDSAGRIYTAARSSQPGEFGAALGAANADWRGFWIYHINAK